MIPTWLQRHLEAAGRWNTDGISRTLSAGRCRHCHQPVVRGLDADIAGLPVTCDPQPINALGEALALIAGRSTYTVAQIGGTWQLSHRDQWRIRAGRPAHILADHTCDTPPLPAAPPPIDPNPRTTTGEQVPF